MKPRAQSMTETQRMIEQGLDSLKANMKVDPAYYERLSGILQGDPYQLRIVRDPDR